MKTLIAITGTYSTGKSTLFDYLKEEFGDRYNFIVEYAKEFLVDNDINLNNLGTEAKIEFQKYVIEHKTLDYDAAIEFNCEDTAMLCTLSYWMTLADLDPDVLMATYFEELYSKNFDRIVFLHIEPVIGLDKQDFRIDDEEYRLRINDIQKDLLKRALKYPNVEGVFTILETDFEDRKRIVANLLTSLLEEEKEQTV